LKPNFLFRVSLLLPICCHYVTCTPCIQFEVDHLHWNARFQHVLRVSRTIGTGMYFVWRCSLLMLSTPTSVTGHAVAHLLEALHYKPEGLGFFSRCRHWNCSLIYSYQPLYGPGVDSVSERNEYQEYFLEGKGGRCLRLTTLPPPCADCHEIWDPQRVYRNCSTFTLNIRNHSIIY